MVVAVAACNGDPVKLYDANNGSGTGTDAGATIDADTTAPDTILDSTPAAATKETAAPITFHSDDAAAHFECVLDGAAEIDCGSPWSPTVAEGDHTIAITAVDAAGNRDATPATYAWNVDTTPPDTTITAAPPALDNSVDVSFEFESEPSATFECSDDGGAYAPCTSAHARTALADGAHTFDVRAIDAVGNVDPTPAHHDWTIDSSTPDTVIDSGPTGAVQATDATFTFHSPNAGAGATFACALDGAAFATCSSPMTYSALAEADHTFAVRVKNAAGTTDPTPAQRAWTVDHTAPTVTITSGPAGPTNDATPSFDFVTAGAPSLIECRVDAGAYAACVSPFTTASLADGAHAITVRVTDDAGNTSSASRGFVVDTIAPTTTITAHPTDPTSQPSASFAFVASESPATFACTLDGAAAACTSPKAYASLTDGAHTFLARATDAAGNSGAPAMFVWNVDTVAPTATITGGPNGLTNDTTPTFTFTVAGSPTTTQCRIGGGAYTACIGSFTPSALADGAYAFEVQVIDAAGNSSSATRSFTVDATPPTVAITGGPSGLTNDPTPSFTFTTSGSPTTVQCRLNGGAYAACTSPFSPAALADGAYTLEVQVIDAANNASSATRSFTVDATPPTVVITGGPSGLTNDPTPVFTFSVGGSPTTVQCRLDGGSYAPCSGSYSASSLNDGAHTFEVQAIDAAQNASSATRSFTIDATPPTVTITGGPNGLTNDPTPTFTFTTGGSPTTVQCRLDGGAYAACSGSYSPPALADGAHTFEVQAIDAAQNASSATRGFTVDATPPTVTITGGPSGLTNDATPTFTFTTTGSPTTTQCRLDGGAYAACSASFTAPALADGAHTFDVQVIDAAQNASSASRSFTVDATAPTVTITGGPSGLTNDATPTFTFTTSGNPTTTQCRLNGGAFAACSASFTAPALADGAYTFEVQVSDAANNSSSATRSFTVDGTPPTVAITGGPSGLTNDATPTFTFTTGGSPTTTQCRLNGGAFAACSASFTPSTLADGAYVFEVQVIDAANNSASATRSFTVDATAPTVTITGGPSGLTNDATPTFTFTTGGSPTTIQCRLNGGTYTACASPYTPSALTDGNYTFEVQVIDAAQNSASATRSFSVDATPPTVTITGGPSGLTNNNVPTFSFTTSGNPTTTQCRIDTNAWAACFATFTPTALADGAHTFEVQVIDAANNSSSATRSFTVDATPPTVTITGGPTGTTNNPTPTFTFTTGGSPTTIQCRMNGGSYTPCGSPYTSNPLADGNYTFEVQVIDAATNSASATRSFTVDTKVTITGSVSPSNAAGLAATVNGQACANNACLVAPGTKVHLVVAPNATWSFSGWTGAAVGCTGTALAIDVTAGTASSSCTANFQQLTVTLTAQPAPIATLTSSHLAWTRSPAVTSLTCALDGAAVACSGTSLDFTNMGPGTHSFSIYGSDGAGAKSTTQSASWIQHVDDGHVVLVGWDFHGIAAPYTAGELVATKLLVNAVDLARPSPTTGVREALIYATPSGSLGATEIANVKAAITDATIHTTDLTSSDPATLTSSLVGKSALIIPDQSGGGAAALGTSWKQALSDFVNRGGVVIVLDGYDSSGNPSQTGALLQSAGLMTYSYSTKYFDTMSMTPFDSTTLTAGLTGQVFSLPDISSVFYTDARVDVFGPIGLNSQCSFLPCINPPTAMVAHRVVHNVETFDGLTSFPSGAWQAGTPNAISVGSAYARDEGTGATGVQVGAVDAVPWAYRSDVHSIGNSYFGWGTSYTAWVRFTNPGTPNTASFAGLGLGANSQGAQVAMVVAYNGALFLQSGSMSFGGAPHFTPDLSQYGHSTGIAAQWDVWYRITAWEVGGYLVFTLTDPSGVQQLKVSHQVSGPMSSGGVAIGVSGGAAMDTVQLEDNTEQTPLFGATTTGGTANSSFLLGCPDGEVMTGASGRAVEAIDYLGALHCGKIVHDTSTRGYHVQAAADSSPGGGGGGGTAFDVACANDGVVTAITTKTATVGNDTSLYTLQLQCTTYNLTGAPGSYALVPASTTWLAQIATGHAGLTYTTTTTSAAGGHAFTGIYGYYGPWPVYTGFTVVNAVIGFTDRPWVIY